MIAVSMIANNSAKNTGRDEGELQPPPSRGGLRRKPAQQNPERGRFEAGRQRHRAFPPDGAAIICTEEVA